MQVYLVGGALRDELLGIKPHDKDYVITGATPTELTALGYKQAGRDFPVFLHPQTHEEYALARTEKKSGHGYTGFICGFGPEVTIEEDLKRRDLTVNAIARSEDGTLVDPWGGLNDLKARVLRHVSPAFTEDPLRVLRTARFAAKLSPQGFTVHPSTLELMRAMAASGELTALTPERVLLELDKALSTPDPQIFFKVLADCGALHIVLPEYAALTARTVSFKGREINALDWCCTALRLINAAAAAGRLTLAADKLAPCRLGLSALAFTEEELKALSSRLRLPKASQEAALLCVRHGRDFMEGPLGPDAQAALEADSCMELFESLDLYRRAERLPLYLACVSAAAEAAAAAAEAEDLKTPDRSALPADPNRPAAELNAGPNLSYNHNPNQKDQPQLQTAADTADRPQAPQPMMMNELETKAARPPVLAAISQEAEAVQHPAAEAAAKAAAGSSTTPTKPEAETKPAAAAETAIKPETKTAAEAEDKDTIKANQAADQAEVQAVKSAETAQEPSAHLPDQPKLLPKLAAQSALLKELFAQSLKASARDLAAQGLKGPALGAALRQERLKRIAACLEDKRHLT